MVLLFSVRSCSGDIEGLDQDQAFWWLHCVYNHYTRVGQSSAPLIILEARRSDVQGQPGLHLYHDISPICMYVYIYGIYTYIWCVYMYIYMMYIYMVYILYHCHPHLLPSPNDYTKRVFCESCDYIVWKESSFLMRDTESHSPIWTTFYMAGCDSMCLTVPYMSEYTQSPQWPCKEGKWGNRGTDIWCPTAREKYPCDSGCS